MAEWNAPLPGTAELGDEGHVEDHNAIVEAISEVRTNVDAIELIEGPAGPEGPEGPQGEQGPAGNDGADGSDADNPFTEAEVADLKALVADNG